jgi:hypothetical protein
MTPPFPGGTLDYWDITEIKGASNRELLEVAIVSESAPMNGCLAVYDDEIRAAAACAW